MLRATGAPAWQPKGLVHQFVDVVRRGQDDGRLCSSDVPDLLERPATNVVDVAEHHRAELSPAWDALAERAARAARSRRR